MLAKNPGLIILWIYISLKHCRRQGHYHRRLIILWIYISLKPHFRDRFFDPVWLSFEFTYLSNRQPSDKDCTAVWLSFEFTYLSNVSVSMSMPYSVWLSFEFTYLSNKACSATDACAVWLSFEFTYLSNSADGVLKQYEFDYPLNLHISQTSNLINGLSFRVDKFKRC